MRQYGLRETPGAALLRLLLGWVMPLALPVLVAAATPFEVATPTPNLAERIERPLRYRPSGQDFVIENGTARFNRPLYGPHTAFRVDASDRPEFAFYLPKKGGLLRLGIATPQGGLWLTDAQRIVTRYRPGSMIYEIRDPALGTAVLKVTVLPLKDSEGLIFRAELTQSGPVELIWAFGGASGTSINDRAGDLLGGKDLGEAWNFTAEDFAGGTCRINGSVFEYQGRGGALNGTAPADSRLQVGDFAAMDSVTALLDSKGADHPVLVGRAPLKESAPVHVVIQKSGQVPPRYVGILPRIFKAAERDRLAIVGQVVVDTPDPFINVSVAAINVSADALWQAPTVMHGNIAWRLPLLGWRGPYALDDLGWFDRARDHFTNWAAKQNTDAKDVPLLAHADPKKNLAADDWKMLHSFGSIPATHYDMNLVFIDALLRHFRWTGDIAEVRRFWPVLQRHLAWEKRLFDRDGLYEAYNAIWASDGLEYGGGGAAHATAYNYLHNRTAARLARLIGENPAPYDQEVQWIRDAMHHDLWLADRGWYAEFKDLLGLKRPHPAAALWSVYHAIDSEVPDAFEAYQALRYVDTQIAHIPVRGPGVPDGDWFTLPSTNWLPYEWSLNNVVLAEMAHTALAYWQAGRADEAWKLWKGATLDAMYLGTTPGNLPNLSAYDVYRRETYRDFGDPTGMMARGLVEGLFGIAPDALAGELAIRPGFPRDWDRASISTPYLDFVFKRLGQTETYAITPKFSKPMRLRLDCVPLGSRILGVYVNGNPVNWSNVEDAIGLPRVEIQADAAPKYLVDIRWVGESPTAPRNPAVIALGRSLTVDVGPARLLQVNDPQDALRSVTRTERQLTAAATGLPGHHTIFLKVRQGELVWWMPVNFEIRPALELVPSPEQPQEAVAFRVRNNTTIAWDRPVTVEIGDQRSTVALRAPAMAESNELVLPAPALMPGTNQVRLDLGELGPVAGPILSWQVNAPTGPYAPTWRTIDLSGVFNDRVTQIFKNEYLAPRSPYASLQIPKQGLGTWSANQRTFEVDDAGLRRAAGEAGTLMLPSGVPLLTPSAADAKNIAFTSRWENFPPEISIPLSGRANHAYLLLAGSTNPMQTQLDNGEVIVTYRDGTTERLALHNPTTWWPIEQDYFTDDYAFAHPGPRPLRVELGTGKTYLAGSNLRPAGGAATVLDLTLDPLKTLQSLTVRTLSNEVVIGLMSLTLAR